MGASLWALHCRDSSGSVPLLYLLLCVQHRHGCFSSAGSCCCLPFVLNSFMAAYSWLLLWCAALPVSLEQFSLWQEWISYQSCRSLSLKIERASELWFVLPNNLWVCCVIYFPGIKAMCLTMNHEVSYRSYKGDYMQWGLNLEENYIDTHIHSGEVFTVHITCANSPFHLCLT